MANRELLINQFEKDGKDTIYTVQKGDTLSDIAKKHDRTVMDIAKSNGISNPDLIYAGQTLNIGGNTTEAPASQEPSAPATGTAGGTPAKTEAPKFEPEAYKDPDIVTQANNMVAQLLANQPGEWGGGTWLDTLNDTINQINNREKFSYDLNGDALYQQYKDKYIQQGKMAMMDTMGQAQAMTGGYGNSYAQSVGNQAYQQSLQQLNDIVPELYQLALDQYNQEGQDLFNQAALLGQQEDREYGMHRDDVSDHWNELNYLTEDARYKAEDAYGKYTDDRDFRYGSYIDDRNYQYQTDRDAISDQQWQATFDEGIRQYNEQMGLTREQWDWEKEQASKANSGGNGGNGGDTGDGSTDFKKAVFSRVDDNGNYVFYIDGKERTYAPGVNPYTGSKNSDIKYGTFDNGYQPNNVKGQKLTKSGITDVVNGVTQNVWKTPDGNLWIWDGTKNKYLEYDDGSVRNTAGNSGVRDKNISNMTQMLLKN